MPQDEADRFRSQAQECREQPAKAVLAMSVEGRHHLLSR
jgi:hypothetical protein